MIGHASVVTGVAAVFVALATSGACSGGSGTTGAAGSGGMVASCTPTGGTGAPSTAVPGPNFQTVRDIATRCAGVICHSGTMNPMIQDTPNLYQTLTTYQAGLCSGFKLIEPCKPEESAFYLAQRGECANIPRMPLECVDNCTPTEDLEALRQWIANGAKP